VSVTVKFTCDGCLAEAEGTAPIRKAFRSISGRSYGIGSAQYINTVAEVAPDGWWPFDPYTYLCYCPECRAKIEEDDDE
jgi:hypothetical protein